MGIKDIGPLLGADEGLNHQIVDTFATLSQTDMAWTEKIWASMARIVISARYRALSAG